MINSAPPPLNQLYLKFPLEIVDNIFQKCAEIDDIVSATCLALTCKKFYPGLKRNFGWEDGVDDHGDMHYDMEKIDLESFLPNSMGGPAFLKYMLSKGKKPWMGPIYTEYDPTYKQFVTPRAFAKRGRSYVQRLEDRAKRQEERERRKLIRFGYKQEMLMNADGEYFDEEEEISDVSEEEDDYESNSDYYG